MTGDLETRVRQHKERKKAGFTKRYGVTKLVYYEEYPTAGEAILREKQLQAGSRKKKIHLIVGMNPQWEDLSLNWLDEG